MAALLAGLGPFLAQALQEVISHIWEADTPVWLASAKTFVLVGAVVLLVHNAWSIIQAIPRPWKKPD